MTIWMEVDLNNKELPTGVMADSPTKLAKMLGLHRGTVCSAINGCRKHGYRCRYVKVEIDDEDD